jgi:hypothetical protein
MRSGNLADPIRMAEVQRLEMMILTGRAASFRIRGIAHVISGTCRTQSDDEARVARGSELFDDIYEQFRRGSR